MKIFLNAKIIQRIISFALVVFLVCASLTVGVKSSKALGIPFGGQILSITICPVQGNHVVYIGAPNGGVFTYSGGMLYSFYQIYRAGPWTLGTYTPNMPRCTKIVCGGSTCFEVPVAFPIGTIEMVGTSM